MKRISRPLGITLRMRDLRNLKDPIKKEEEIKKVKMSIIDMWAGNNMKIDNKIMSVEDIGRYLNLEEQLVMKYMWKSMGKMGRVLGKRDAGEIAREIFGIALKKILESHALTAHQAAILMANQGDKYVPFLSSATNQALGNLNAAQAPILALLKVLTDKQETNIIINQNNSNSVHQHITPTEALNYIQEQNKGALPEADPDTQAIEFAGSIPLPDTNPNTQNLAIITAPKVFKEKVPLTHEDRREVKERIIEDIEDPDDFIA